MPPIHKPLKNDGPACRVCGCTEHNACLVDDHGHVDMGLTCSWVKTSGADAGPLCSACAGTAEDLARSLQRVQMTLNGPGIGRLKVDRAFAIAKAARIRYANRKKGVDAAG